MKNRIKSLLIANVSLLSAALLFFGVTSCKDEWNEHYDPNNSGRTYEGTIMGYLESQSELSDFAEIVKKAGFDVELESSQMYTLWAPKNGTFDKQYYLDQISQGDSWRVIKEFIKNHMTRYNVSYNPLEEEKEIILLNTKLNYMTNDAKFGDANMYKQNIKCKNGIVHMIDASEPYLCNLYEEIENVYKAERARLLAADPSLTADSLFALDTFLKKYNSDSLDINRSVERGVDEKGNKIYVDSVVIRNNTILKGLDALLYMEDSSYNVIIPSIKAYQERYNEAKKYLVYNPSENIVDPKMCDSLQDYYANMFAMVDIYHNANTNKTWKNYSTISTSYRRSNWENHVYYHPYDAGGIFTYGTEERCCNGKAYLVSEYPLSIFDQFYKKIDVLCGRSQNIDQTTNAGGTALYTKNVDTNFSTYNLNVNLKTTDEEGNPVTKEIQANYLDVKPTTSAVNPYIAFKIRNTLSAKYDMYLAYCPIWVRDFKTYEEAKEYSDELHVRRDEAAARGDKNADNLLQSDPLRPYYFRVYTYERANTGANIGSYPTSGTAIKNPEDGKNFYTTRVENHVDTLFLGTYECKNAYYNTNAEGILVQLQSNVTSKNTSVYSREMYLCKVIFVPHVDDPLNDSAVKFRKR